MLISIHSFSIILYTSLFNIPIHVITAIINANIYNTVNVNINN